MRNKSFSSFFKDCRSKINLNREEIAYILGINADIIKSIEHSSFEGIDRRIIERLIFSIISRPKERNIAFFLLNEIYPKKVRRSKYDSRRKRRLIINKSHYLKLRRR